MPHDKRRQEPRTSGSVEPAKALGARWIRAYAGLGRPELARRSGLSTSTLHRFEKEETSPSSGDLDTLLETVELPIPQERFLEWCREATGTAGPTGEFAGLLARAASRPLPGDPPAAEDRARVPDLWSRFQARSLDERRWLIRATREYRSWAFAEHLCAESRKAAADDGAKALELAELALLAATLTHGGLAWSCSVQGFALGHLANAQRVLGNQQLAVVSFNRGKALWEKGGSTAPGLLNEVQLLSLEVSLLWDQRRAPEALALSGQALHKATGRLRIDLLIQKASAQEALGNHLAALETLRQAEASQVEWAAEPKYRWLVRFTTLVNLCHLGRVREAAAGLPEVRALAEELGNELDRLRLTWLEGRIAAGLGDLATAAELFEKVRRAFTDKKIAYDAALVTLELAAIQLEQGRTGEAGELAAGLVWVFQSQGVPAEAAKALALFGEAARQELASAELARRVGSFLQRAEHVGGLCFECG